MNRAADDRRWLARPQPRSRPEIRLFCFSYAGGGAATFQSWPQLLPAAVDVCAVRLPGRESRFDEPPHTSMTAVIDELAPLIARHAIRPYAFIGHSLGALVAFELARRLRRDGVPLPRHLFASARIAPQLDEKEGIAVHTLPDALLREHLRRLEGTPAEVLGDEDLMALVLPAIRADYQIAETYRHTTEPPLDVPISAFMGLRDSHTDPDRVEAWREQASSARFDVVRFQGGHFFIDEQPRLVTEAVVRRLFAR